ncbi:MAG: DUF1573 domain-containing protein [Cytophagales bacterium]|nr:DUF1573 domain-containing protein [Cytophagales bacterium]
MFFPKTEFETWKIQQGNTVSTQFSFSNLGKKDLVIMKVKTNCSCTTADAETKTVKPGESSTIKISFQTEDREGWEEKLVTVYSNDPVNPVKILKIRASIVK